ncbi:MinD/ParA family protein [Georgenia sp. SYP-B2076]|uniref:MinD/ParA family ATP-binding protein n=1 Tax=Georgenia sp. SYP-B2076 TaxID=2495881 RepID=UPI000F8F4822|nr:MinD/ParA family protein [Georgenia sp. SYP-B2076]
MSIYRPPGGRAAAAPPAPAVGGDRAGGGPAGGDGAARWSRAAGVASLGMVQDSGLKDRAYLVRRGDGQVVQVSELLHLVLMQLSGTRSAHEVAGAVSAAFGRRLGVEGLDHLARTKLLPLGLVTDLEAPAPPSAMPRARPLLSLSLRFTLVPARGARRLAAALAPLYWPPVVVLALAALVALDVALVHGTDAGAALQKVLATPGDLAVLVVLLTVGAVVHEIGHATACVYGGASPGVIGAGVYVVFPALYTDVTDAYRLGRAGRLRTDLGGLYFNVWCLLALGSAFLATGQEVFFLAALLMHVEMVQQLIPNLRFDGYFVLADLAGVPDLFARVGPVLRGLLPGREQDPRVTELRPGARRIVTAWVLVVVPTLLAAFAWMLWHLPVIVPTTLAAISVHVGTAGQALAARSPVLFLGSVLSVLLLALPLAGLALVLRRLALLLLRPARRRIAARLRHRRTAATIPARRHPVPLRRPIMVHPSQPAAERRSTDDPVGTATLPAPSGRPSRPTAEPAGHPAPAAAGTARPAPPEPGSRPTAGAPPGRASSPSAGPPPEPMPPPPAPLSAAAFTDAAMFAPRREPATEGWQRFLHAATSGRVSPRPGARERRHLEVLGRMRAPIVGSRRVVVMSRKGGVGKTTLALALGSTFAVHRGDRVIAVDANPDAGNLAYRLARGPVEPSRRSITDVLGNLETIRSYADLQGYTSQAPASRLEVLASDDDPRISLALAQDSYHCVITLLDAYYNLILLDTGTGILDSANQGLIADADQLVLVLRPALDGARAAALTLDWLDEHGHSDLVERAVVVVNGVRPGVGAPLEQIEDHFTRRCAHVGKLPWDQALEKGAQTDLAGLGRRTRDALNEVAAAVADSFIEVRGLR